MEILLSGAVPGGNAGNAVSTAVMQHALSQIAAVTLLSHNAALLPSWREERTGDARQIRIGTQPITIHGEALLAGRVHRRRLRQWRGAWVVNSRYAGAPYAAGVPYIIWEATTARDELTASTWTDVRGSARGTGLGYALHRGLLPVGERMERRIYGRASAIMAMSSYTRARILATHDLPPERVGVLLHPPGPAFLNALGTVNGRRQASRTEGPWRLLFVGRADDARKNFAMLPAVVRRLADMGRPVTLTVIGPHNDAWRTGLSLDGTGDAVRFTGAVSLRELVQAYGAHDLLVLPSRQEGFGIVVAEALAAGLPVVATRCGGPEQMIEESGAGVLVPVDVGAMTGAIAATLADPSRIVEMSEAALAYSAGPLHPDRFAEAVGDMTRRLLDRPRPA